MRCYLSRFGQGIHPDYPTLGEYAVVTVFFYRFGEENVDTVTNRGTVWTGLPNPYATNANFVQRWIIHSIRNVRFYENTIGDPGPPEENDRVRGHFVGFVTNQPPVCPTEPCPPSLLANTVSLVE